MASYTPPKMQPNEGRKDPFRWLQFSAHTDYVHVDAMFLSKMNEVGKRLGKVITIISGYRSRNYGPSVGGYANDPHERGVAVDAYIGSTPIGLVPGAMKAIAASGLESGNQPNFYQGKTDPEHVQIPNSGVDKSIHAGLTWEGAGGSQQPAPPETSRSTEPAPPTTQVDNNIPQTAAQYNPAVPDLSPPDLSPTVPGPAGEINYGTAQFWQQLASDPLASPETKQIAAGMSL